MRFVMAEDWMTTCAEIARIWPIAGLRSGKDGDGTRGWGECRQPFTAGSDEEKNWPNPFTPITAKCIFIVDLE